MDPLEKILAGLSNLNLDGKIVLKQPHAAGLGGSCDVFSAWSKKHNKKVAIKQVRAYLRKDKPLARKLAKELCIWAKLDHEFVLPLLGFFVEGENMLPSLVSEWMEKGTLHDFKSTFPRGGAETCLMLHDIAAGLAYLHSKNVIHADLKSHNILILPAGRPLIADFGLSLALSHSITAMGTTSSTTKGTVRWMAIELLPSLSGNPPTPHNAKSDIWSFGMVAYELLSWNVPYVDKSNDVQVLIAIINGELPKKPLPPTNQASSESIFKPLWEIAQSCWITNPAMRPNAIYLRDRLKVQDSVGKSEHVSYVTHGGDIWHHDSPNQSERENGHSCHVRLTDTTLWFLCNPGTFIGPVVSAERRIPSGDSSYAWPSRFEFCVTSAAVDSEVGIEHFFSVTSSDDASEWGGVFRAVLEASVQAKTAPLHSIDSGISLVSPRPLTSAFDGETLEEETSEQRRSPVMQDEVLDNAEDGVERKKISEMAKARARALRSKVSRIFP